VGHKKVVYFDLYETLITEWRANKKKASYSIEKLGLDEMTYKIEWMELFLIIKVF
jgi:putative hydrolase of the HAD superfamily